MKKAIYLFILIFFYACQNPANTSNGSDKNEIKDTVVNERSFIELGGEKQYVEMTGASSVNPVLLFLHGGPGWPQTPHLRYFNSALTKSMTVVAWEQSGCGQSYINNPTPGRLSLDQIINDAHELTQILKKKFKQDKILLAGFSWGSMVGLKLVEKYPEDYSVYFGISQVIDINKNIQLSREWIRAQARLKNDNETLKMLTQIEKGDTSICKRPLDCFLKQYELLSKYGGAIYRKESDVEIEKAVTEYSDYKNYDWFGGFTFSAYQLEKEMFGTNLNSIKELKIPAYFFIGRHDWNVPAAVTEEFIKNLKAPIKEIVWFENSGHEPLEEEADKFNQAIIERIIK